MKDRDNAEATTREQKGSPSILRRFWLLWRDGMRHMTWGKPLWILNIIKLIIMFGVLKLFFFPNFLKSKSDTPEGRQEYVRQELVERGR